MNGFIYILTNKNNSVLYTGVTSNLKGGSRKKKVDLINSTNPEWKDLSEFL